VHECVPPNTHTQNFPAKEQLIDVLARRVVLFPLFRRGFYAHLQWVIKGDPHVEDAAAAALYVTTRAMNMI
jgi:hypothetical protein